MKNNNEMKTGIIIITYNIETRLFLLQIECIKKFCTDNFVIEIIDNSTNIEIAEAIKYHSCILGLNYNRTYAIIKEYSQSHSFAANAAYQKLKDYYDIIFFLDHDCIPVAPFSCDEILGEKLFAGVMQKKEKIYFWPGCFMFQNKMINAELVDFSVNHIHKLDTGGNLYQLIEYYGEGVCRFFSEGYCQNPEYSGKYDYFSIINDIFWHCIGGSNWFNIKNNDERINKFINAVTEKING